MLRLWHLDFSCTEKKTDHGAVTWDVRELFKRTKLPKSGHYPLVMRQI